MTETIIRKLQARFDKVPDHVVKTIAEAALAEAGTAKRLDGQIRHDSAKDDRQAERDRDAARRDHAADEIANQWKRGASK